MWRQAGPRERLSAAGSLLVSILCWALLTLLLPARAGARSIPPPRVNLRAIAALGQLAFPWRGELWIAGPEGLHDLGAGAYPLWSPEGRYLAYLARPSLPGGGPEPLRLRRADGASVRLPELLAFAGEYAWLPGTEELVVAAARPAGIDLVDASTGRMRTLVTASDTGSQPPSFAPSLAVGQGAIAYSDLVRSTKGFADRLYARRLGGPSRLLALSRANTFLLAGVEQGRVLFWVDPQGSGSIAADGMDLLAVPLTGGPARQLTFSLGYVRWVVPGPPGHVYVVAGGAREVWEDKRLVDCSLKTDRCSTVYASSTYVPSDPAYDPVTARLAFVLAKKLGAGVGGFGSDARVLAWLRSHVLAVAKRNHQGISIYGATAGAYAPAFAARGSEVVYIGLHGIDALALATGRRVPLVSGLSFSLDDLLGYYGARPTAAYYAFRASAP